MPTRPRNDDIMPPQMDLSQILPYFLMQNIQRRMDAPEQQRQREFRAEESQLSRDFEEKWREVHAQQISEEYQNRLDRQKIEDERFTDRERETHELEAERDFLRLHEEADRRQWTTGTATKAMMDYIADEGMTKTHKDTFVRLFKMVGLGPDLAQRTANFWRSVGIEPGTAMEAHPDIKSFDGWLNTQFFTNPDAFIDEAHHAAMKTAFLAGEGNKGLTEGEWYLSQPPEMQQSALGTLGAAQHLHTMISNQYEVHDNARLQSEGRQLAFQRQQQDIRIGGEKEIQDYMAKLQAEAPGPVIGLMTDATGQQIEVLGSRRLNSKTRQYEVDWSFPEDMTPAHQEQTRARGIQVMGPEAAVNAIKQSNVRNGQDPYLGIVAQQLQAATSRDGATPDAAPGGWLGRTTGPAYGGQGQRTIEEGMTGVYPLGTRGTWDSPTFDASRLPESVSFSSILPGAAEFGEGDEAHISPPGMGPLDVSIEQMAEDLADRYLKYNMLQRDTVDDSPVWGSTNRQTGEVINILEALAEEAGTNEPRRMQEALLARASESGTPQEWMSSLYNLGMNAEVESFPDDPEVEGRYTRQRVSQGLGSSLVGPSVSGDLPHLADLGRAGEWVSGSPPEGAVHGGNLPTALPNVYFQPPAHVPAREVGGSSWLLSDPGMKAVLPAVPDRNTPFGVAATSPAGLRTGRGGTPGDNAAWMLSLQRAAVDDRRSVEGTNVAQRILEGNLPPTAEEAAIMQEAQDPYDELQEALPGVRDDHLFRHFPPAEAQVTSNQEAIARALDRLNWGTADLTSQTPMGRVAGQLNPIEIPQGQPEHTKIPAQGIAQGLMQQLLQPMLQTPPYQLGTQVRGATPQEALPFDISGTAGPFARGQGPRGLPSGPQSIAPGELHSPLPGQGPQLPGKRLHLTDGAFKPLPSQPSPALPYSGRGEFLHHEFNPLRMRDRWEGLPSYKGHASPMRRQRRRKDLEPKDPRMFRGVDIDA